ncbi:hypothetical protein RP20_CCG018978 [Aedes albopictus]|nr:hypothetical protein RP20_CCG018978 [Aedes albopictus]
MNYHRFESILAASPRPQPRRPSSSADVHPVAVAESDDNDSSSIQQQPQQPFRRTHSMRASFTSLRSLKTRLKHPVVSGYSSGGSTRYTPLAFVSPCRGPSPHQRDHSTSTTTTTLTTAAAAAAKANLKAKLLRLKESYAEFRRMQSRSGKQSRDDVTTATASAAAIGSDNFKVPENMPPKAAALLLEGAPRSRVKRSQSLRCGGDAADRYGVTIGSRPEAVEGSPQKKSPGKDGGGSRLTVKRLSLKMGVTRRPEFASETKQTEKGDESSGNSVVIRTATIRRSSVWANSSSSSKKCIFIYFLLD